MEFLVAMTALALALGAAFVAWRARQVAVRVRRRLREAEARGFEPEPAPFAPTARVREEDSAEVARVVDTLRRRVESLESRLEAATSARRAASPPAAAVPDEVRVREHLRSLGWEPTSVAPLDAARGTFAVEALRAGVVGKGTADVAPGGRVNLRLSSALRAFP